MVHHSKAVYRALKTSYIVTDLPFSSYESSPQQAFASASTLLRDGLAEAVKLEGGKEMAATISHLVNVGVPVMGHVGLMPQRAKALGGFHVQGNTALKVWTGFCRVNSRLNGYWKMLWRFNELVRSRWFLRRCHLK
jgi:3-methyl-2-oxobutanoate hydroxymethyltransferase